MMIMNRKSANRFVLLRCKVVPLFIHSVAVPVVEKLDTQLHVSGKQLQLVQCDFSFKIVAVSY
jgi:hypothetical protein